MPSIAKLTRPKTHRVLRRERLFALIDAARERPLVWVSGAPGAGKSTLVASYVEANKGRAAWYHLDPGDDDIGTFFYYLAQSLPAGKSAPQLPQFGAEHRANIAGFSRQFFRQFFARPTLLVLDNYHELAEASAIHEVLDCAVAEVPEGSNIAVISRGGPPRRFARHKLGEKLAAIEGEQLRTSLEETRAIAGLRHDLDEEAIARVHALSRGWAAGLALTLEREEQIRSGRISGDGQAGAEELFEFFAIQVFDSLPQELQQFLQVSALLPTMTAAMAQRLSGREDAEAVLEDLYRRGLFTDRRATEPPTYQYHDLFRAFLTRRHEQAVAADALAAELHLAGTLLQAANQSDDAVRLFLRAQDWPAARMAILGTAGALVAQGRSALLRDWIGAIPRDVVAADPWLNFWAGVAELRRDPASARPSLTAAFQLFEAQSDLMGQTLACGAIMHSHLYQFTDVTPLDPWIDTLTGLLERRPRFPTAAAELQVMTALLLSHSFRRPRRAPLEKCVERMLELIGADVPDADAASACGALLIHFLSVGDIVPADRTAAHLHTLHDRRRVPPAIRALGAVQFGRLHWEKCAHAASVRAFEEALELVAAHAISLPVVTVQSHLGLAVCAIESDDLSLAESHRQQLEKWWMPQRRMDEFASSRLRFWLACRRGHWDAALELADRQAQCARDCGVFWAAFEACIQRALVCAELDRPAEFEASLAPVRPMFVGTGYEDFTYQLDLTEAYYALLKGDRAKCHEKLRSGLERSRYDNAKRTLRMHPMLLSRLFAEAIAAQIEVEYVQQSIRALHLRPPSRDVKDWPWPLRIYTFGQFEVLRDGRPLEYSRKAPRKTIALLKAIIAFGGTNVREQRLVDAFWSDEEGDVATRSLGAALHRLRKLLGDAEAIVQQGGALSLDKARVWVDVWAFEDLLARPDAGAPEVMSLYRGAFCAEDDGEPWPVTMRERLRGRFIHAIAEIGRRLEESHRPDEAIECYLRGLDADPVIEQFYQGLMRCYTALERRSEALSAYQRLKRMLSISLGVAPSAQTERLYQSLKKQAVGS
jgi:LuxR family transcriptional regulator, maltose regulon positive regulatory protein